VTTQKGPASAGADARSTPSAEPPFAQRFNVLDNGIEARQVTFASANPRTYEDIIGRRPMPRVTLEAKLYLPSAHSGKAPAVVCIPGSGGVNLGMLDHARALTDIGVAAFVVDPFGGRDVRDTVTAQGQFSFAASTYDVFAAMRELASHDAIDASRLGAMGYSRGGISVLQAAIVPLARAALGDAARLRGVLAGWPWCGYQFADPQTAPTAIRYVAADSDNYVSVQQSQGYAAAMRFRNSDVAIRLVRDARHGFGYGGSLRERPEAVKALSAPVIYFDAEGVLLDPWSQQRVPDADDRTISAMLAPFVTRGVHVGSKDGQQADFIADLTTFFSAKLG
jgi:dienelactone hydrolase